MNLEWVLINVYDLQKNAWENGKGSPWEPGCYSALEAYFRKRTNMDIHVDLVQAIQEPWTGAGVPSFPEAAQIITHYYLWLSMTLSLVGGHINDQKRENRG